MIKINTYICPITKIILYNYVLTEILQCSCIKDKNNSSN